jgi:phosphoribosyl 1,2-cyclic phosphodiesterase
MESEYDHVCSFPLDSSFFWGSGDIHYITDRALAPPMHDRRRRMSRVIDSIACESHTHTQRFRKKIKKEPFAFAIHKFVKLSF